MSNHLAAHQAGVHQPVLTSLTNIRPAQPQAFQTHSNPEHLAQLQNQNQPGK